MRVVHIENANRMIAQCKMETTQMSREEKWNMDSPWSMWKWRFHGLVAIGLIFWRMKEEKPWRCHSLTTKLKTHIAMYVCLSLCEISLYVFDASTNISIKHGHQMNPGGLRLTFELQYNNKSYVGHSSAVCCYMQSDGAWISCSLFSTLYFSLWMKFTDLI